MKKREDRSPKIKALNAICASVLLCSAVYVMVAGMNIAAMGIMATSVVGLVTPVVLSGEGILEIVTGIFEAVFEGIAVIVVGFAEIISGFFG